MDNNPESAVSWFELAIKEDSSNTNIYNYLGISYEQMGESGKAIEVYKRGLEYAGSLRSAFLTNIGNNYVLQGNFNSAVDFYSQAIEIDNNVDALRNRAGEYIRNESYSNALNDYKLYLTVEPQPYQESEIKRVIALLELKIDDFARKQLEEEHKQLEEERKRLEEEARQRELLSKVLNSLDSAGDQTTNLSAGTETAQDYEIDFDIIE